MAAVMLAGPTGPVYAGVTSPQSSPVRDGGQLRPAAGKIARTTPVRAAGFKLPLYFEANRGQTDASVKFFTRAAGYNLYLAGTEAVMVMPKTAADKSREPNVLRMKLKGANTKALVQGLDILPGRTSYFYGSDRSKWQVGVEQYARVKLAQVYPGIDMVYRFDKGHVEYDFVVAPGANPWRILLGFEGAKGLRLDPRGNLVLRTASGEMTYKAPQLYQTLGSKRVSVKGRFVLASNNNVRFEVGNYIKSKELVIDPALTYSSFLGGATVDKAYAIALDASGNAYLTGSTTSTDFPTAGTGNAPLKADMTLGKAGLDVFVTKVNAAGTALLWSVYLGGAADDVGRAIAVNSASGKVYIAGDTTGSGTFPFTASIGIAVGTGFDAFVAGINGAGTSPTLIYADRFGGAADDFGNGIAVNASDEVYATGTTQSIDSIFPTTVFPVTADASPSVGARGAFQAYVMKFDSAGAQSYGTYLGGTGVAYGNAIAIDAAGNAYVAGKTGDNFYATAGAFSATFKGGLDAFIAKLNPAGSSFVYKTFVGGAGVDEATGIAVDGASPANIYITGNTLSADFPATGVAYDALRLAGAQTTIASGNPGSFIFKLTPSGTAASDGVYSTYVGLTGATWATAIALDSDRQAYITGYNTGGDMVAVDPVTVIGVPVIFQGNPDAFIVKLSTAGNIFGLMSYFGGTAENYGQGIAVDSVKNIYITGYTSSNAATFPKIAGGFQQTYGGGTYDAFVSKIGLASLDTTPPTIAIDQPANGSFMSYTSTMAVVSFGDTGGSLLSTSTLVVELDGNTIASGAVTVYTTSATFQLTGLAEGNHTLDASIKDNANNLAFAVQSGFTVALAVVPCRGEFFYPSPATGATGTFEYCMNKSGTAKIRIYNAIGDLAAKIEDSKGAGVQSSTLNTGRLAPGVYLYRLEKNYNDGTSATSGVKKFVVKH